MGALTLFLGGAKSGKTRLALAETAVCPPPWIYLATAENRDAEMDVRIKNHQAERGPGWRTVEAPLDPAGALDKLSEDAVSGGQAVLLDCLTLWLSNLLAQDEAGLGVMAEVERLLEAIERRPGPVIVVSNEVGGGIVPMNALARRFRDLSGSAHQLLAARAEKAALVVAGLPLWLKTARLM